MVGDKKNYPMIGLKVLIIALLAVFFLVPFWLVITGSFTEEFTFIKNGYSFGIGKFSIAAYQFIFENEHVMRALLNSVFVCVAMVTLSVIVNTVTAYTLAERDMPGHSFFNLVFVFTMFFSAGMVPTFLVIQGIGLYDSLWALILPGVVSVYNILLIRSYFYGVSPSLKEAAYIDGANHVQVLWKIMIPISMPIIITTGLISLVTKWNSWMDVLIYLDASSKDKWTLQYVVRQILTEFSSFSADETAPSNTVKNAIVIITVLPLLIPFPFFQKYFANGITIGSVKG